MRRMRPAPTLILSACLCLTAACVQEPGVDPDAPITSERIETALRKLGVGEEMAGCVAGRVLSQLDRQDVLDLEELARENSSGGAVLSDGKAMGKLRALPRRKTATTIVGVAGGCGFDLMMQGA
ncbi:MAG: hypothetical protein AAGH57_11300 [Pseudomonadota bacterium]